MKRTISLETRKKISESLKRAYAEGRKKRGSHPNEKTREKISEGLKRAYAEGRRHPYQKIPSSKEELERLYWKNNLTQGEIAKKFHATQPRVSYWFEKLGIQSRPCLPIRRNVPFKKLTNFERGRISALIDGEGSITLACHRDAHASPRISIANTSYPLLKEAKRCIGGSIHLDAGSKKLKRPIYQLYISGIKRVYNLLKELQPYFGVEGKKLRAKLIIRFCEARLSSKTKYYGEEEKDVMRKFREVQNGI